MFLGHGGHMLPDWMVMIDDAPVFDDIDGRGGDDIRYDAVRKDGSQVSLKRSLVESSLFEG